VQKYLALCEKERIDIAGIEFHPLPRVEHVLCPPPSQASHDRCRHRGGQECLAG
jgi:hypothetical protein